MVDRECGSCTQCCKTMRIAELDKPENSWCDHCDIGTGCDIYETKPDECTSFVCGWLTAPDFVQELGLTDDLRPDKSKVVLAMTRSEALGLTMVAYVDPDRPDAYKNGNMGKFLAATSDVVPLVIITGDERKLVLPPSFGEQAR